MPNCTKIKPKPYKVCTADLRYQITINSRTKGATNSTSLEPNLTVTAIITVFAMQKSVNGEEIFQGTNIVAKITDEFYIRYNPALTLNLAGSVTLDGAYYDIQDIIPNLEGRKQFTVLRCSKRGSSSLSVNKIANL